MNPRMIQKNLLNDKILPALKVVYYVLVVQLNTIN